MDIKKRYWDVMKARKKAPTKSPILYAYDVTEAWHKSPDILRIVSYIKQCATLLDIGAGDNKLKEILEKAGWKGSYFSLDIEQNFTHNYNSIEKIGRKFDCITFLETIEHLPLEIGIEYCERAYALLEPKGILIVSTPNIRHLNQFWQGDVTHIRPWPYSDLYAILKLIGFSDIEIFSIKLVNPIPTMKDNLIFILRKYMCKIIGVDFTEGIMAFAQKG